MVITDFKKVVAVLTAFLFISTSINFNSDLYAQPMAVTLPALDINKITVNGSAASLEERFQGTEGPEGRTVIAVQDAHGIFDAQENIRVIIQELQDRYGFELVGLEGGIGKSDHTFLRTFPDKEINQEQARKYMKRAELSGGEAAAILNPKPGIFYGIENRDLYFQNRNSFIKALETKDTNLHAINLIEKKLDKARSKIFPEKLIIFHRAAQNFQRGRMSLLDFVTILQSESAAAAIPLNAYPNVLRLFEAIAKARKAGNKESVNKEVQDATSKIEGRVLFEEIEKMTEAILSQPQRRQSRKIEELLTQYHELQILRNLVSLQLTRKEYLEFLKLDSGLRRNDKYKDLQLTPAETFYRDAVKRDQALYDNFIAAMKHEKKDRAIIVTGGFHEEGLRDRLRKENISYVFYMPRIQTITPQDDYYRVMSGKVSYNNKNGRASSIQAILATMGLDPKLGKEFNEIYAVGGLRALAKKVGSYDGLQPYAKIWQDAIIKTIKERGETLRDPSDLIALVKNAVQLATGKVDVDDMLTQLEQSFNETLSGEARDRVNQFINDLKKNDLNVEKALAVQGRSLGARDEGSTTVRKINRMSREIAFLSAGKQFIPEEYQQLKNVTVVEGASRAGFMGDVQGNFKEMKEAMVKGGFINAKGDWTGGAAVFGFAGDLVDSGPESAQVLDFIMKLTKQAEQAGGRVIAIHGNHDDMMLQALEELKDVDGPSLNVKDLYVAGPLWWNQGGKQTAISFLKFAGIAVPEEDKEIFIAYRNYMNSSAGKKFLDFIKALPYAARVNNVLLVHGGPDFEARSIRELGDSAQSKKTLTWARHWEGSEDLDVFKRNMGVDLIVYGHTQKGKAIAGKQYAADIHYEDQGLFAINVLPRASSGIEAQAVLNMDDRGIHLIYGKEKVGEEYLNKVVTEVDELAKDRKRKIEEFQEIISDIEAKRADLSEEEVEIPTSATFSFDNARSGIELPEAPDISIAESDRLSLIRSLTKEEKGMMNVLARAAAYQFLGEEKMNEKFASTYLKYRESQNGAFSKLHPDNIRWFLSAYGDLPPEQLFNKFTSLMSGGFQRSVEDPQISGQINYYFPHVLSLSRKVRQFKTLSQRPVKTDSSSFTASKFFRKTGLNEIEKGFAQVLVNLGVTPDQFYEYMRKMNLTDDFEYLSFVRTDDEGLEEAIDNIVVASKLNQVDVMDKNSMNRVYQSLINFSSQSQPTVPTVEEKKEDMSERILRARARVEAEILAAEPLLSASGAFGNLDPANKNRVFVPLEIARLSEEPMDPDIPGMTPQSLNALRNGHLLTEGYGIRGPSFMENNMGETITGGISITDKEYKASLAYQSSFGIPATSEAEAKAQFDSLKKHLGEFGIKLDEEFSSKSGGNYLLINRILSLIPAKLKNSPSLRIIELNASRVQAARGSAYDDETARVAIYPWAMEHSDRRLFVALMIHEIGHSIQGALPDVEMEVMGQAHAVLGHNKAFIHTEYFMPDRAGYQYSYPEFFAEMNLIYISRGDYLRDLIKNHPNPKVREAYRKVYEIYRNLHGREYSESQAINQLDERTAKLAGVSLDEVRKVKKAAEPIQDVETPAQGTPDPFAAPAPVISTRSISYETTREKLGEANLEAVKSLLSEMMAGENATIKRVLTNKREIMLNRALNNSAERLREKIQRQRLDEKLGNAAGEAVEVLEYALRLREQFPELMETMENVVRGDYAGQNQRFPSGKSIALARGQIRGIVLGPIEVSPVQIMFEQIPENPGALKLINQSNQGDREYVLEKGQTVVIGRSTEAGFRIIDPKISRNHVWVTLSQDGNTITVHDTFSTSGTFYRIDPATVISDMLKARPPVIVPAASTVPPPHPPAFVPQKKFQLIDYSKIFSDLQDKEHAIREQKLERAKKPSPQAKAEVEKYVESLQELVILLPRQPNEAGPELEQFLIFIGDIQWDAASREKINLLRDEVLKTPWVEEWIEGYDQWMRQQIADFTAANKIPDEKIILNKNTLSVVVNLSGFKNISDVSALSRIKNLKTLYVVETDVSDLKPLLANKNLEKLYLRGSQVTPDAAEAFKEAHPNKANLRVVTGASLGAPVTLSPEELAYVTGNVLTRKDGNPVLLRPYNGEWDLMERLRGTYLPELETYKEKLNLGIQDQDALVIPGYGMNGFLLAEYGAPRSVTVMDKDPVSIAWLKAIKKYWNYRPGPNKASVGEIYISGLDFSHQLADAGEIPEGLSLDKLLKYMIGLIQEGIKRAPPTEKAGPYEYEKNISFTSADINGLSKGRDAPVYDFVFIPWLIGLPNGIPLEKESVLRALDEVRKISKPNVRIMITPSGALGDFVHLPDGSLPEREYLENILNENGYNATREHLAGDQSYLIAVPVKAASLGAAESPFAKFTFEIDYENSGKFNDPGLQAEVTDHFEHLIGLVNSGDGFERLSKLLSGPFRLGGPSFVLPPGEKEKRRKSARNRFEFVVSREGIPVLIHSYREPEGESWQQAILPKLEEGNESLRNLILKLRNSALNIHNDLYLIPSEIPGAGEERIGIALGRYNSSDRIRPDSIRPVERSQWEQIRIPVSPPLSGEDPAYEDAAFKLSSRINKIVRENRKHLIEDETLYPEGVFSYFYKEELKPYYAGISTNSGGRGSGESFQHEVTVNFNHPYSQSATLEMMKRLKSLLQAELHGIDFSHYDQMIQMMEQKAAEGRSLGAEIPAKDEAVRDLVRAVGRARLGDLRGAANLLAGGKSEIPENLAYRREAAKIVAPFVFDPKTSVSEKRELIRYLMRLLPHAGAKLERWPDVVAAVERAGSPEEASRNLTGLVPGIEAQASRAYQEHLEWGGNYGSGGAGIYESGIRDLKRLSGMILDPVQYFDQLMNPSRLDRILSSPVFASILGASSIWIFFAFFITLLLKTPVTARMPGGIYAAYILMALMVPAFVMMGVMIIAEGVQKARERNARLAEMRAGQENLRFILDSLPASEREIINATTQRAWHSERFFSDDKTPDYLFYQFSRLSDANAKLYLLGELASAVFNYSKTEKEMDPELRQWTAAETEGFYKFLKALAAREPGLHDQALAFQQAIPEKFGDISFPAEFKMAETPPDIFRRREPPARGASLGAAENAIVKLSESSIKALKLDDAARKNELIRNIEGGMSVRSALEAYSEKYLRWQIFNRSAQLKAMEELIALYEVPLKYQELAAQYGLISDQAAFGQLSSIAPGKVSAEEWLQILEKFGAQKIPREAVRVYYQGLKGLSDIALTQHMLSIYRVHDMGEMTRLLTTPGNKFVLSSNILTEEQGYQALDLIAQILPPAKAASLGATPSREGRDSDKVLRDLERERPDASLPYISPEWAQYYERAGGVFSKLDRRDEAWAAYMQAEEIRRAMGENEEADRIKKDIAELEAKGITWFDGFDEIDREEIKKIFVREGQVYFATVGRRIFRKKLNQPLETLSADSGSVVFHFHESVGHDFLFSVHWDGQVRSLDLRTGAVAEHAPETGGGVSRVQESADHNFIFIVHRTGQVRSLDLKTGVVRNSSDEEMNRATGQSLGTGETSPETPASSIATVSAPRWYQPIIDWWQNLRVRGVPVPETPLPDSREAERKIKDQGYAVVGGSVNAREARNLFEFTGLAAIALDEKNKVYPPNDDQGIAFDFARAIVEYMNAMPSAMKKQGKELRILVVGTGTGLDALTAAHQAQRHGLKPKIDATDIYQPALDNTQFNFEDLAGKEVQVYKVGPGRAGVEAFQKEIAGKTYDLILFNAPDAKPADSVIPAAFNTQMNETDLREILDASRALLAPDGVFLLRNLRELMSRRVIPENYNVEAIDLVSVGEKTHRVFQLTAKALPANASVAGASLGRKGIERELRRIEVEGNELSRINVPFLSKRRALYYEDAGNIYNSAGMFDEAWMAYYKAAEIQSSLESYDEAQRLWRIAENLPNVNLRDGINRAMLMRNNAVGYGPIIRDSGVYLVGSKQIIRRNPNQPDIILFQTEGNHLQFVNSLNLNRARTLLLTTHQDSSARIINLNSGNLIVIREPGWNEVKGFMEDKTGTRIFLNFWSGRVRVVNIETGEISNSTQEDMRREGAYYIQASSLGQFQPEELDYLAHELGFHDPVANADQIAKSVSEKIKNLDGKAIDQFSETLLNHILSEISKQFKNKENAIRLILQAKRNLSEADALQIADELLNQPPFENLTGKPEIKAKLVKAFTAVVQSAAAEIVEAGVKAEESQRTAAVDLFSRNFPDESARESIEAIALQKLAENQKQILRSAQDDKGPSEKFQLVTDIGSVSTLFVNNAFAAVPERSSLNFDVLYTKNNTERVNAMRSYIEDVRAKLPEFAAKIRMKASDQKDLIRAFQGYQKRLSRTKDQYLIFIVPDVQMVADLREAPVIVMSDEDIPEELSFVKGFVSQAAVGLAKALKLPESDARRQKYLAYLAESGITYTKDPQTDKILFSINLQTFVQHLVDLQRAQAAIAKAA